MPHVEMPTAGYPARALPSHALGVDARVTTAANPRVADGFREHFVIEVSLARGVHFASLVGRDAADYFPIESLVPRDDGVYFASRARLALGVQFAKESLLCPGDYFPVLVDFVPGLGAIAFICMSPPFRPRL